jgi:SAM-dependent methyltransferase
MICGRQGVPLYDGLTDTLAPTPGTWRFVRCADPACALLWLDPKPLEADLIEAYAGYHTHGRAHARDAARLWLSAVNAACKFASRLPELGSGLGRQRRALRTMFIGAGQPGRLLEVGCGAGRFLHRMRRAGWSVAGVEFDPDAAARVQRRYGIRVDVGGLADMHFAEAEFDVVAMSQVIEHVHDPLALLRECHRVLRPSGRLLATTPNALGLAHRLYGRHWRGLEPPRHLHVFTPAALEHCARMSGFPHLRLQTLSAESAGIYRASDEIKAAQSAQGGAGTAASIARSWRMRWREYRETLRDPSLGQDILLVATK